MEILWIVLVGLVCLLVGAGIASQRHPAPVVRSDKKWRKKLAARERADMRQRELQAGVNENAHVASLNQENGRVVEERVTICGDYSHRTTRYYVPKYVISEAQRTEGDFRLSSQCSTFERRLPPSEEKTSSRQLPSVIDVTVGGAEAVSASAADALSPVEISELRRRIAKRRQEKRKGKSPKGDQPKTTGIAEPQESVAVEQQETIPADQLPND